MTDYVNDYAQLK